MQHTLAGLFIFTAKFIISIILLLLFIAGFFALIFRAKGKTEISPTIKHLNQDYHDTEIKFQQEVLPKKEFKQWLKIQKEIEKENANKNRRRVFIIDFHGDIKASAVNSLREEVTAILAIATANDEVIVRLESAGGMVHAYGLAAAQLVRLREKNISLTVIVDKIAASGGYMMACVANRIIAAPFAIIGSIGVILQLPNFHRLLKEKHIDFEQLTAGNFKRTLTLFGQNTEEGREKMRQEIESIHHLFKNMVKTYRPDIDIEKVATGEHWAGIEALEHKLVDVIRVSDDVLQELTKEAELYSVSQPIRKSFVERLFHSAKSTFSLKEKMQDYAAQETTPWVIKNMY